MRWSQWLGHHGSPALSDGVRTLSYRALLQEIAVRAEWLRAQMPQAVAIDLPNGIDWVLWDMACAEADIPCVPVPGFFSVEQRRHALTKAGVDWVISLAGAGNQQTSPFAGISCTHRAATRTGLPKETGKITFTSGSTGAPKGVCLSIEQQLITATTLSQAIGLTHPVHLALLPLATLLENIAGIYTPLLSGGTVYVPDNRRLGFVGSRLLAPEKLLRNITDFQPDTLILVPELLQLLVKAVEEGWTPPASLQFIAVGGARVATTLLARAGEKGLPVYQGYGLSECGSVVALNTPSAQCSGAIGQLLPHVRANIKDGELYVSGNTFLGYLNEPASWYAEEVATGDLVARDSQGYLWFEGRRCNRIVSSFGRNISPEWPESELLSDGLLRQAVVLGDDRPHCVAVIVPYAPLDNQQLEQWLWTVNQRLPDYAQIRQCLLAAQPLSSQPGLFTDNGRPNRAAIGAFFAETLEALYRRPENIIQPVDLLQLAASNTARGEDINNQAIVAEPE